MENIVNILVEIGEILEFILRCLYFARVMPILEVDQYFYEINLQNRAFAHYVCKINAKPIFLYY